MAPPHGYRQPSGFLLHLELNRCIRKTMLRNKTLIFKHPYPETFRMVCMKLCAIFYDGGTIQIIVASEFWLQVVFWEMHSKRNFELLLL
jgi:hypothetical protein